MMDTRFGFLWTVERVEQLRKLWTEGYTASQCAQMLGGVSRNAVIGKAHRLNLEKGGVRGVLMPMPAPEPKPEIVPDLPSMPELDDTRVTPFMCRWPTATVGAHGLYICGHTVQPGRKFCAEHITAAHLIRNGTNKRLDHFDTVRMRTSRGIPMGRRSGAA